MSVRVVAGASSPRRRLPVAAPLVLLGVFVLGGLMGRLTAPSGTRSAVTPAQAGPGPSRVVTGIPLGFAHSRKGAVAALAAYGAVLSNPNTLLDSSRRAQVLRLVATPRYAATFAGSARAQLEAAAKALPPVYFAAPISFTVLGYDGASATVSGWGVSVAGGQGSPPQAQWATSTTTARWIDGDWKIDTSRTSPGPTPTLAPGDRPSSGSTFFAALRASHGLRHVP